MAIPNDLTREDLILAMREFDDQIRDKQQRWSNWEQNRNHIYAIEYDGYKYPVKKIIRMAAGHADFGFYGGKGKYAANRFIENRNLTISLLREQQEPRNGTEVTTEQRSTRTPANYEFGLVAYFLSRYGTSDIDGNMNPPEILGTSTWIGSYALFYDALGQGRDRERFYHSLKNARDRFDAHIPGSGRIGWRGTGPNRTPARLPIIFDTVLKDAENRTENDIYERISELIRSPGGIERTSDQPPIELEVSFPGSNPRGRTSKGSAGATGGRRSTRSNIVGKEAEYWVVDVLEKNLAN